MEFEFDADKNIANKTKHGIDFVEAQTLWDDPDLVEIPARISDELRFLVLGRIREKRFSAIVTYHEDRIRLISVRQSRREEVEIYES